MGEIEERQRLEILHQYQILDTPREQAFDRISELAKLIFEVPVAYISLIDADRQWCKSAIGTDRLETPRDQAFCNETIRSEDVLVISDTMQDRRTASNPLVHGEPFVRFYAGAPLLSPERARLGSLCILDRSPRAFSEKQQKILATLASLVMDEMALRRQTERDWLTGAVSRGTFHTIASKVFFTEKRTTGIISFDIDHFKQLNDRFGHSAGDRVLVEVVATCQSAIRDHDILSRVGGEEFTVLLPNVTVEMVMIIAERLRLAIKELEFAFENEEIRISASFGVTLLTKEDTSMDEVLRRVDRALYSSKAKGRDCLTYI